MVKNFFITDAVKCSKLLIIGKIAHSYLFQTMSTMNF